MHCKYFGCKKCNFYFRYVSSWVQLLQSMIAVNVCSQMYNLSYKQNLLQSKFASQVALWMKTFALYTPKSALKYKLDFLSLLHYQQADYQLFIQAFTLSWKLEIKSLRLYLH